MKDKGIAIVSILLLVLLAALAMNYDRVITGDAVKENVCQPYDRVALQAFKDDENPYGKVTVAIGDVDLDNANDIITGSGDLGNSKVKAYSLFGTKILEFNAFSRDENPNGDVYVAAGDVDEDGISDIIAGTGLAARTSLVRVFDHDGDELFTINAFDSVENPYGKVTVAIGDVDSDGHKEIIAGSGKSGKSRVKVFSFEGEFLREFNGFAGQYSESGVYVAVGDVVDDSRNEIIVGSAESGNARARIGIFDGNGKKIDEINAMPSNNGMVSVAAGDVTGGDKGEIIAGSGGNGNIVIVYDARGRALYNLQPFKNSNEGGEMFVATANVLGNGKADVISSTGKSGSSYVAVTEVKCGIDIDCVDKDNDGSCYEDDCLDINYKLYPNAMELCDKLDNNCNGIVDEQCGKCVPMEETCNDGKDNDCNQKVDCDDGNCANTERCLSAKLKCDDGTAIKSCSEKKPYYCDENKELSRNCGLCGCPVEQECDISSGVCNPLSSGVGKQVGINECNNDKVCQTANGEGRENCPGDCEKIEDSVGLEPVYLLIVLAIAIILIVLLFVHLKKK